MINYPFLGSRILRNHQIWLKHAETTNQRFDTTNHRTSRCVLRPAVASMFRHGRKANTWDSTSDRDWRVPVANSNKANTKICVLLWF